MRRRQAFSRNRILTLEGLEERNLLAVASFSRGTLNIVGDNTSETVTVTEVGFQSLLVEGDGLPAGGTLFNFVRSISVDMKGGDDSITIGSGGPQSEPRDPIEIWGPITIKLGAGSDRCNLYVNTLGTVSISDTNEQGDTPQNETVYVGDSIIGTLKVSLGIGNDELYINQSAILSLNASLGVNRLAAGQVDADACVIQDSAIGFATISLGTAQQPDALVGLIDGAGEREDGCDSIGNRVEVHATLLGKLTITGGDACDRVTIDSSGDGIGPNIRPHLVSMVEDLEPAFDAVASLASLLPVQQIFDRIDALFSQFRLPGGFDIPFNLREINWQEVDLSDLLDEILSREELSFITRLGDDTIIVAAMDIATYAGDDYVKIRDTLFVGTAKIDTGNGDDCVRLCDVTVLGVFPPIRNPLFSPSLIVLMGSGNDHLKLRNVVSISSRFDGGNGDDTFTQQGEDNFLLFGTMTKFETSTT